MIVRLQQLELTAYHGVYEEERKRGTQFMIDTQLQVDVDPDTIADDLSRVVDYTEVYDLIHKISLQNQYQLLETWAVQLVRSLLAVFPLISEAKITISKPGSIVGDGLRAVEVEYHEKRSLLG